MCEFQIYTDGAYSSSRNQGGWSYIIIYKDQIIKKRFFGEVGTTNNRMEMQAVLEAIKDTYLLPIPKIIYSDSMYVIGTLTKHWKKNKNLDLWEKFDKYDLINFTFKHVKGHANNTHNNLCDYLAVLGSNILL